MMTVLHEVAARIAAHTRDAALAVVAAGLVAGAPVIEANADPTPTLLWERYPGTAEYDFSNGVAVDSSENIIVIGGTYGSFGKQNAGKLDGLVAKYAPDGVLQWRRQPASYNDDRPRAVATDKNNNIVVVGSTSGPLGGPRSGGWDAFIIKYAPDGSKLWNRHLGTAGDDDAYAVAIDAEGNIVVAGRIGVAPQQGYSDAFLIKYTQDGTELWRRQLQPPLSPQLETPLAERAFGVAIDEAESIVVVGETATTVEGLHTNYSDTFIAMFSADGDLQWLRQQDTSPVDRATSIIIDATGTIFVGGYQVEGLPNAIFKAYLAKYSLDGLQKWRRVIGGGNYDSIFSLGFDADGNVLISGLKTDVPFFASFTTDGTKRWIEDLPNLSTEPYLATSAGDIVIGSAIYRDPRALDVYLGKYTTGGH